MRPRKHEAYSAVDFFPSSSAAACGAPTDSWRQPARKPGRATASLPSASLVQTPTHEDDDRGELERELVENTDDGHANGEDEARGDPPCCDSPCKSQDCKIGAGRRAGHRHNHHSHHFFHHRQHQQQQPHHHPKAKRRSSAVNATLSLGPTTTTTVVTTTTTTTTTFPSLPIKPPPADLLLDPARYPLAGAPTPPSLKRFSFDLDGQPTFFDEPDPGEDASVKLHTALQRLAKTRKYDARIASTAELPESSSAETSPTRGSHRKRPASVQALSPPAELRALQAFQTAAPATMTPALASSPPHKKQRPAALRADAAIAAERTNASCTRRHGEGHCPSTRCMAAADEPRKSSLSARSSTLPSPLLSPTTGAALAPNSPYYPTSESSEDDYCVASDAAASQRRRGSYTPSLADLPTMIQLFDTLPQNLQSYLMFQFMRRCSGPTLQFMSNIILPTLKRDFLGCLPVELSHHVLRYLDVNSMCRAACVSKRWRNVVDDDAGVWRRRLEIDGFDVDSKAEESRLVEHFGLGARSVSSATAGDAMSVDDEADVDDGNEFDDEEDATASSHQVAGEAARRGRRGSESAIAGSSSFGSRHLRRSARLYVKAEERAHLSVGTGTSPLSSTKQIPQREQALKREPKARHKHALRSSHVRGEYPTEETAASADARSATPISMEMDDDRSKDAANMANQVSLPLPPSHDHPYKVMYKRKLTIRRNWKCGKARHISFPGHGHHVVTCLQFDEDKIISGSDDQCINVYDMATGRLRKRLEGHEGGVWALQYVGNTLVSGSTDRTVRVWDIERGVCTHVFSGHTSTVRCLQIIMPRKDIADDGFSATSSSSSLCSSSSSHVYRPAHPLIVTGSRDATLRVWRLPSPTLDQPQQLPGSPTAEAAAAPQGRNPFHLHTLAGHTLSVRALSGAGEVLVSGSYDCTVRVWNLRTGETRFRLVGHSQKVYSVVLDYERRRCMSGSMDGTVRVWSLENGSCIYQLEGHTSLVGLLDLTPNHLVSAAADHTLRIWSPETGTLQHTLDGHSGAITCFQHDATKVVSGSDGTLKMWDVNTGRFVRDVLTDLSGVWQVRFDESRCVAAVQRMNGSVAITWFEVLDYNPQEDEDGGEAGKDVDWNGVGGSVGQAVGRQPPFRGRRLARS